MQVKEKPAIKKPTRYKDAWVSCCSTITGTANIDKSEKQSAVFTGVMPNKALGARLW